MKLPWKGGTKVYINGPGHITKMAAMPIGGFRNSLCDVIFAHAHIAGRQYNGQHNGQAYGIHVKM